MLTNEDIAAAFTALSHKRRVLIFRVLQDEGAAVSFGSLMSKTGLSSTTLNHHLGPVIEAGVVKRKVRGSFCFLSLQCGDWIGIVGSVTTLKAAARRKSFKHPPDHRPTAY